MTRSLARSLTLLLLSCLLSLGAAGCGAVLVGSAVGAGTYVYMDGKVTGTYAATMDDAIRASRAALADLSIPLTAERRDGDEAELRGKLSRDTVSVDLELVGADLVEISVRVGLAGNRTASQRIHAAIGKHL